MQSWIFNYIVTLYWLVIHQQLKTLAWGLIFQQDLFLAVRDCYSNILPVILPPNISSSYSDKLNMYLTLLTCDSSISNYCLDILMYLKWLSISDSLISCNKLWYSPCSFLLVNIKRTQNFFRFRWLLWRIMVATITTDNSSLLLEAAMLL